MSAVTAVSLATIATTLSIDRDIVGNTIDAELAGRSVPGRGRAFRFDQADQAIVASEIARQIDVSQQAVSTVLARLTARGVVEQEATYWAMTGDDERPQSRAGFERSTALFSERRGEDSMEGWLEPARHGPHPSTATNE